MPRFQRDPAEDFAGQQWGRAQPWKAYDVAAATRYNVFAEEAKAKGLTGTDVDNYAIQKQQEWGWEQSIFNPKNDSFLDKPFAAPLLVFSAGLGGYYFGGGSVVAESEVAGATAAGATVTETAPAAFGFEGLEAASITPVAPEAAVVAAETGATAGEIASVLNKAATVVKAILGLKQIQNTNDLADSMQNAASLPPETQFGTSPLSYSRAQPRAISSASNSTPLIVAALIGFLFLLFILKGR